MERKLVLSLIACAGLSFTSATVALADDRAPDSSATTSTDTSSTTTPTAGPQQLGGRNRWRPGSEQRRQHPEVTPLKTEGRLARAALLSAGQCRDRQHGT